MNWKIEFSSDAHNWLRKSDPQSAARIIKFLSGRVANLENPRSIGEALNGPVMGKYWKYRVGDYRIIAEIFDKVIQIRIIDIGHRREIYRR